MPAIPCPTYPHTQRVSAAFYRPSNVFRDGPYFAGFKRHQFNNRGGRNMIQFPTTYSLSSPSQADVSISRNKPGVVTSNTAPQGQASFVDLEIVRAEDFLSTEEKAFIGELKSQYNLSEDEMNAFYVVGLMRHGNLHAGVSNPDFFSKEWFGQQMNINPTITGRSWGNRPYQAAIEYLQSHTAPRPPERLPNQSHLNVYA